MEENILDKYFELRTKFLDSHDLEPTINPLDDIDSEDLITSNLKASDEAEAYQDDWKDNRFDVIDNSALIDDLFSHYEK